MTNCNGKVERSDDIYCSLSSRREGKFSKRRFLLSHQEKTEQPSIVQLIAERRINVAVAASQSGLTAICAAVGIHLQICSLYGAEWSRCFGCDLSTAEAFK